MATVSLWGFFPQETAMYWGENQRSASLTDFLFRELLTNKN